MERPRGEPRDERIVRLVMAILAAALVVFAMSLPVWEARLQVIQYPGRELVLTAHPDRLDGDVEEIRILNHYVGLQLFDMAELIETRLWWPAIAATFAAIGVAWAFPRRRPGEDRGRMIWPGTLGRLEMWLFPLGILVDIQLRLYELGHSMDPGAAFRQEPFTPPVVGAAQVSSNVHTISWPGTAVWCLLAAAVCMTFGVSLYRFSKQLLGLEGAAEENVEAQTPVGSTAGA